LRESAKGKLLQLQPKSLALRGRKSMPITKFSICLFVPDDGAIGAVAVEFESGFVLEAGLKPNVNQARVSYLELEKLGTELNITGQIQFFYNANPNSTGSGPNSGTAGSPDVAIKKVTLVDVDAKTMGIVPGETEVRVVEWTVYFADFRCGFIAPRGGRLRQGYLNVYDAQLAKASAGLPAGAQEAGLPNVGDISKNSELMQYCLSAMNMAGTPIRTDIADAFLPSLNLQWHGSHAPSELQKLLAKCNLVFCPHLDGTASIELIGDKGRPAPKIPDGDLIHDVSIPSIDRRGKSVVFSSSPHGKLVTDTISGPNSDTWQFVVQDSNDQWVDISTSPKILAGFDPAQLVQKSFTQLNPSAGTIPTAGGLTTQQIYRLACQLYFCIRLNPDNYPPDSMPILRQRREGVNDDFQVGVPRIHANIAAIQVGSQSQLPVNTKQFLVPFVQVNDGSVIVSSLRLGKMTSASATSIGDYDKNFTPLVDGDLKVRFTYEDTDDDDRPIYFEIGFTQDVGGTLTTTDDGQGMADTPTPETLFIHRPDLVWLEVHLEDGSGKKTDNLADLKAKAKAAAQSLLRGTDQLTRQIHARGFVPCDCSGQVAQIIYKQHEARTEFILNNWFKPLGAIWGDWAKDASGAQR
jgi:hypothetical protein